MPKRNTVATGVTHFMIELLRTAQRARKSIASIGTIQAPHCRRKFSLAGDYVNRHW
jgi:hypothetical protein